MDIVIRRAVSTDALFLTSVSVVAKRYCECIKENFEEGKVSIITKEYIESSIVFIAEKENTIIAYCSLYEVKQGSKENKGIIHSGYWLNHIFIRPAYTDSEIGKRLIEELIAYCRENNIKKFNVLSLPTSNDFYIELGATYIKSLLEDPLGKESCLFKFIIFNKQENVELMDNTKEIDMRMEIEENMIGDEQSNRNILQRKLFELDKDAEEDEPYEDDLYDDDGEAYRENESSDDDANGEDEFCEENGLNNEEADEEDELCEENELQDDEVDEGDKPYEEKELHDDDPNEEDESCEENELYNDSYIEETVDDNNRVEEDDEPCAKGNADELDLQENSIQDKEQFVCRLSYEDFRKTTVPIGYKFECEEKLEKKKSQSKALSKEIEYGKIVAELEEDIEQVAEKAIIYPVEEEAETKTEKEKMLEGSMYIAWGEEIVNDKKRARRLLREFNDTDSEDRRMTYSILKKLFGRIGEYIHIEPEFKCSYGYNIYVGNNCCIGYNCVILDHAQVTIGENCIISPQVGIYTLAYPLNAKLRASGYEYAKPITIGDNVWIGGGAIINPGISIGDNVVISPGAVVFSDVPDNALVRGNPAKIINYIAE